MKDLYYWYDMPEPSGITTPEGYADPYELLEAMRYRLRDRWSFMADYDELTSDYAGNFAGHGIGWGLDQEDNTRITWIFKNSPLYPYGVQRGWIIKEINNVDVTPDLLNSGGMYDLIGPPVAGITNTFLFINPSGEEVRIKSTKASFMVNTVFRCDILQLSNGPTGYLVIDGFIDPTGKEMAEAFAYFKANGVKDLILDLRYNSGGDINGASGAQYLSSYIAGSLNRAPWINIKYNDMHPDMFIQRGLNG
jgi:C-terminal processing protease CtpA/Prc